MQPIVLTTATAIRTHLDPSCWHDPHSGQMYMPRHRFAVQSFDASGRCLTSQSGTRAFCEKQARTDVSIYKTLVAVALVCHRRDGKVVARFVHERYALPAVGALPHENPALEEKKVDDAELLALEKSRPRSIMSDEYEGVRYRYGMTLRPPLYGGAPDGWLIRSLASHPQFAQHGTLDYPFPLTRRELDRYSLVKVTG